MTDDFQTHAVLLGGFVALIWVIGIANLFLLRGRLNRWGIRPRTMEGLRGILLAPLLHSSWSHLATNTVPFVVLGWLVMLRETNDFLIVTAVTLLTSGLGTWIFGATNTVHVGASGLVFGYFGFLLLRSYFEQNLVSAVFALIVVLLYGRLIWGILPFRRGISWQGHLFGLIGGGVAARFLPQLQQQVQFWLQRF